ncbi:MAG: hypothetical protein NPIRA04_22770 [Nitrospirales bacterium]|nr:MAG: hypothetical protein NPIRA04_22770 [Nitrospirales bacterium]
MSRASQFTLVNSKYRWIVLFILAGMILLGLVFLQFTESYIQELKSVSQEAPQEAFATSTFLLVGIAMVAGFPAIGIGTYLLYQGNQIRVAQSFRTPGSRVMVDPPIAKRSSARMRGEALMVCGGLVIMSGLGLPILAWWLAENL